MKTFFKEVDTNNRVDMMIFLASHHRYNTMSSWNDCTSYSNNIKFHNLDLDDTQYTALCELIETAEFSDKIDQCIEDFTDNHNSLWTAGKNGRSGGYLVLYRSSLKTLGYKSRCTACGQLNYTTIEESGSACGVCREPKRVNLTDPIKRLETHSGQDVDMNENFEDWSDDALKDRVELIQAFDMLTDDIVSSCIDLAENFEVIEEVVMIPKTIKVLKERSV